MGLVLDAYAFLVSICDTCTLLRTILCFLPSATRFGLIERDPL
jgi:hypothetical protein